MINPGERGEWTHKKMARFLAAGHGRHYLATVVSLVLPHFGHLTFTLDLDQVYTSLPHFEQTHASPAASGLGGRSSFPHS